VYRFNIPSAIFFEVSSDIGRYFQELRKKTKVGEFSEHSVYAADYVFTMSRGRVQQLTGRIGRTIGTACVRQVSCWTTRTLGRAHLPPTKVFPRLAVNKTILEPRLAAATGAQYLHGGFSRRTNKRQTDKRGQTHLPPPLSEVIMKITRL